MDHRTIALDLFRQIQAEFPNLLMDLHLEPEHVDLSIDIPVQPGLIFPVSLNLQNRDELHINVGQCFWLEWFPCDSAKVLASYHDAVCGILRGTYRVVEYGSTRHARKAILQRPEKGDWKTIGKSYRSPLAILPWWKRRAILQNK